MSTRSIDNVIARANRQRNSLINSFRRTPRAPIFIPRAPRFSAMSSVSAISARPRTAKNESIFDICYAAVTKAVSDKYVLMSLSLAALLILTNDVKFSKGFFGELLTKYPDNQLLLMLKANAQRFFGLVIMLPVAVSAKRTEQFSMGFGITALVMLTPSILLAEYMILSALLLTFFNIPNNRNEARMMVIMLAVFIYFAGFLTFATVTATPTPTPTTTPATPPAESARLRELRARQG